MELETINEVKNKEWFCWGTKMLVLKFQQQNILAWEFKGLKVQKMALEKQFDVKSLLKFAETNFGNSYNVDE